MAGHRLAHPALVMIMMMMVLLASTSAAAAAAAEMTTTTTTAAAAAGDDESRSQDAHHHHATLPPNTPKIMFYSFLGRSHMTPYLEALQLVAARGGADVSVVTDADAAQGWLRTAYPGIPRLRADVPHEIASYMHKHRATIMQEMADPARRADGFNLILTRFTLPTYAAQARHVRAVLADDRPDLLLCDALLEACMDVAQELGVPYALTMSGVMPGWSDAPYVTSWFCAHGATTEAMTLWQRLQCKALDPVRAVWRARGAIARLGATRKELGLAKAAAAARPGARDRGALKLVNSFFGFETPRPLDPLVQLIGPVKTNANTTLPADVDAWLGGRRRVVYVAFGTHVDLPERVLQGLMGALLDALDGGLADGVVWAISNIRRDKFPRELDARVLLLAFAPQKALLNDARVVAFVSHGGAESSHEAMLSGTPLLVVPFFGDQPLNAIKLANAGNGVALPQHEVTRERARAALERLLAPATRGAFEAAAARMRAVAAARSRRAVEQAADDLEVFARFGWAHLVPADRRMSWAKATDADLWAAAAAALALAAALLGALARLAWRRLLRGGGRAGDDTGAALDKQQQQQRRGAVFKVTADSAAAPGAVKCRPKGE